MERRLIPQRPDWQRRVEDEGMLWHTAQGVPYWHEGVCYVFGLSEVERIEAATEACHRMAMDAVGAIIEGGELPLYGYGADAIRLIEQSWQRDERDIYGRIDFAYDGQGEPRMLEYNADTPTSLLEASVVQWSWMTDILGPEADNQFNDLHNALVERMSKWAFHRQYGTFGANHRDAILHVSCVFPHDEDTGTVAYIESVAREAGIEVRFVPIDTIGYSDEEGGIFLDQDNWPIRLLFKLYPWDWLLSDDYGPMLADAVLSGRIQLFEPAWKMLLANKLLLARMWEMNPDSPYLLETHRSDRPFRDTGRGYVRKPALGREGQNVSLFRPGETDAAAQTDGSYADNDFVCQALAGLFVTQVEDKPVHALIGSWVIDGEAKGMGIRESDRAITDDQARFVPHYFVED